MSLTLTTSSPSSSLDDKCLSRDHMGPPPITEVLVPTGTVAFIGNTYENEERDDHSVSIVTPDESSTSNSSSVVIVKQSPNDPYITTSGCCFREDDCEKVTTTFEMESKQNSFSETTTSKVMLKEITNNINVSGSTIQPPLTLKELMKKYPHHIPTCRVPPLSNKRSRMMLMLIKKKNGRRDCYRPICRFVNYLGTWRRRHIDCRLDLLNPKQKKAIGQMWQKKLNPKQSSSSSTSSVFVPISNHGPNHVANNSKHGNSTATKEANNDCCSTSTRPSNKKRLQKLCPPFLYVGT